MIFVRFFLPSSPSPLIALEAKTPSGYYRRHLLFFHRGTNAKKLNDSSTDQLYKKDGGPVGALAWVIRHFVPLVVDEPGRFFGSMLATKPLFDYMTVSDLAFAFLVLEHYMMKWRAMIHFELETGRPPSKDYSKQLPGLLYNGGISGREAKRRFGELCSYLYSCVEKNDRFLKKLQAAVDALARKDSNLIKARAGYFSSLVPSTADVEEYVLHRVFQCLYLEAPNCGPAEICHDKSRYW